MIFPLESTSVYSVSPLAMCSNPTAGQANVSGVIYDTKEYIRI